MMRAKHGRWLWNGIRWGCHIYIRGAPQLGRNIYDGHCPSFNELHTVNVKDPAQFGVQIGSLSVKSQAGRKRLDWDQVDPLDPTVIYGMLWYGRPQEGTGTGG